MASRKVAYSRPPDVLEAIKETRKHVQHRLHHPPETRTRLLTAYKDAFSALDHILMMAELYAQQQHKDVFPLDVDRFFNESIKALAALEHSGTAPEIAAVRAAVEEMQEFAEMKMHHLSPETVRWDICMSLKIK